MKTIKKLLSIFILLLINNIFIQGATPIIVKILGNGTENWNTICPQEHGIQYTAEISTVEAGQTYQWTISGGSFVENNPFGLSAHVNWNSTKPEGSITFSVLKNGQVIGTKTQTIYFRYFNSEKPAYMGYIQEATYRNYYFDDPNFGTKKVKYDLKVTLPEGCKSQYGKTGTFIASKTYGTGVYDHSIVVSVINTKPYVKGIIECVSVNNSCGGESAIESIDYEAYNLSAAGFTEYPTNGIPYGSSNTYRFSVTSIPGVSYSWKIPNGWTLASGQNTNSIQVKHNPLSLNISNITVDISKTGTPSTNLSCPYKGITGCDFKISGPDTIYTSSPEDYFITGATIPSGSNFNWTLGKDLYLISGRGSYKVNIGRATAEGSRKIYTEIITSYASYKMEKEIIASSLNKPGTEPKPEPEPQPTPIIEIQPETVSNSLTGIYENIENYLMATRKYYYFPSGRIFFKCRIRNLGSTSLNFDASKVTVSYHKNPTKYAVYVKNESFNNFSTILIPGNGTIYAYLELTGDWMNYRETTQGPGGSTYYASRILLYYENKEAKSINYYYLFTTFTSERISVSPTNVSSDITVKSEDNIPLKMILIIDNTGNIIKSRSFTNNCTEATLNMSDCKKGLYYIQVNNGIETNVVKVIKQ